MMMTGNFTQTVYSGGRAVRETFTAVSKKDYGQEKASINLYPEVEYQTWEGFGGTFTEASAYLFDRMSAERKEEVLRAYFDKEEGLGYTEGRMSMDSCDASLDNYSALEKEIPADELSLPGFSVERDERYILPFCREALKRAGELNLMLSPWSPPPFMKTNGEKNHGGSLKSEYRRLWAAYFVRYIKEYEKRGIHINSVSIQNEPIAVQTWDSCIYTAHQEKEFLRDYLYPALLEAGLEDVDIFIWDHNKERVFERTAAILDEDTEKMAAGVAFHWYSGDHFEAVSMVGERWPHLKLRFSEGCVEYSVYAEENELSSARMFGHDIAGNMNAGTSSFITWSFLFDEEGGPNHVNNFCDAPVRYDTRTDTLRKNLSYDYIGHFARFIVPGSVRIGMSRYTDELDTVAFRRPDGKLAVVIMNRTGKKKDVFLRIAGEVIHICVAGDGIMSGIFL